MNTKVRKIIFNFFVAIFFVIGAYLLVMAQGFLVDFKNLQLIKTGAIFLKFEPADATIILDGKNHTASKSFWNTGVLIRNLIPSEYDLILRKSGYHEWKKKIIVEPGLVTKASQIKLWPINPRYEIVAKKINDFTLTAKGFIAEETLGKLNFSNTDLKGGRVILNDARINYAITSSGQNNYFLIDLENPKTAINLGELFYSLRERQLLLAGQVPISKILFHPFSQGKILITTQNAVYSVDFKKISIEKLTEMKNLTLLGASQNEIFLSDQNQKITVFNLVLKTKTVLPITAPPLAKIEVTNGGNKLIFLTLKNQLFIYERASGKLEKIANDVREYQISPEEKRLAFIAGDNELKIFYLQDYENDTKENRGNFVKIELPTEKKLSNFTWLKNSEKYFIIFADDSLVIGETDVRVPLNFYTLANNIKKFALRDNNLYLLGKDGELRKLEI